MILRRWPGWVVAAAIPLAAACSRDVGECWLPSQDGQGGAVGGPSTPQGGGSNGDAPPSSDGHRAADVPCPEPAEDGSCTMADLRCKSHADWGVECMIACAEQGKPCPAGVKHSTTGSMCLLYQCTGCKGKDLQCWYSNPEKVTEVCVQRPDLPKSAQNPLCKE